MNKGLEALENLCNQCEFYQFEKGLRPKKCPHNKNCVFRNRIEKELKESEKKDHYIETLEDRLANIETTYARKNKALEIVKVKRVNVWRLFTSFRTKELWSYNNGTLVREYKLTQEEYDLLKEVLL